MPTNLFNPADRRKYPARWPMRRGKQLFEVVDNRSEDGTEELLSVSHITGITPRSQKNVTMFKSESLVGYKRCEVGDIAANTMWTWQGAIGVSDYAGVVSPAYNVYRQRESTYNPRYLDFLLREKNSVAVYHSLSTGIRPSRLRLYPDVFLTVYFPVPSMEEQEKMVHFLDWKVSKINALINIKKKQLSLLKMRKIGIINNALNTGIAGSKLKDSTIYGLTQIPETWIERPLKYFVTSNDESLSGKTPDDYEIDYIDISTTGFRCLKKEPLHLSFGEAPSRARRIVREGDTILSTVRTYLKAVLYIDGDLDGHVASTGFSVLRPKKGVYSKLLSYALSCDYFIDSVIRNSAGTSYPAITDKRLLSLKLALPASEDEQKDLFEYITQLTATTDDAIASLNAEIISLQSLKERLISDVITGNIDTRNVEVPEYEYVMETLDADDDMESDDEFTGEEE